MYTYNSTKTKIYKNIFLKAIHTDFTKLLYSIVNDNMF